ncbi:MAG: hypothetical protein J5980_09230 [Muribaculaceae bacterium]|nr:hypothetical protein [Muribaculaceae bacterium]
MKFTEQQLLDAHKHTMDNRHEIERSMECACFDCGEIYNASEVTEWADNGNTALCPHCGIDCVLGDASGIALTSEFLNAMYRRWF